MPGTGIFMTSTNFPRMYGYWVYRPGGIVSGPPLPIETLDYRVPVQPTASFDAAPIRVNVNLPAEADLYFNGTLTNETGPFRTFVSPAVAVGRDYVYDIRARWVENGRPVTWRHDYTVRAGDRLNVDVGMPGAEETAPVRTRTELRPRAILPGTVPPGTMRTVPPGSLRPPQPPPPEALPPAGRDKR
jgi:uncharacterized protein (TIGR03000 family)